MLGGGAGGQGPLQSPVLCVALVVLDACPSSGKCRSGGNVCGPVLSQRQELISVLESFSFPPLGHRKTKPQGAGRAPGAAGLDFTARAGLCSQSVRATPTEGECLRF